MTLSPQLCAEIIRSRQGIPAGLTDARIIFQIPTALKAFGRKYAADPFTRQLVSTDKNTTTLTIGTRGKVDLVTGYDSFKLLMEYFDKGQIYLLPAVPVVGAPAIGTLTLTEKLEDGDTITINGEVFTFRSNVDTGGNDISLGADPATNAATAASALNASNEASVLLATYFSNNNVVTIVYKTNGAAGNAYTLAGSSNSHAIASGPTLTGGASAVDTSLDSITIDSLARNFTNLDRVRFTTSGTLPGGLDLNTDYYLLNYSVTAGVATTQLSSTANGLNLVDITSSGFGAFTMVKMDATGDPMQPLRNPQQMALPQYLSNVFDYFTVQGNSLFIQQIDGAYPAGTIALAVPFYPTNLAALPDSEEAERAFLDILLEQCMPGTDIAENREH